jgi:hypothetical protein
LDAWVARHPAITLVLGPDAAMILAAPISAPIVEEIAKALGVVLIFWLLRNEFDNVRDGFVYGALVGVGFNWSEAALYVAQGYAESGVAPYGQELGGRYAICAPRSWWTRNVHRDLWCISRHRHPDKS